MESSVHRVRHRRTSIMAAGVILSLAATTAAVRSASAVDAPGYLETGEPPLTQPPADQTSAPVLRDDERPATAKPSDNGQVKYISGGIGQSGMRVIDAEAQSYNLKMLFVSKGAYLADVRVSITDSKGGTVLATTTTGPVLLVKMKPGHYTVSTKSDIGTSVTQEVDVGKDHLASYVLRYDGNEH